ncbi:MAG: hypothetical protein GKR94_16920 [Gammaproteobacteria bacterium]|nr:hypothetical protein [Gammaproteobacteria bacterium]
MSKEKADLIYAICVIAIAVLMLTVIIPYGIDAPDTIEISALAPAFWPNIIMGLTVFIGVIMALRAVYAMRAGQATPVAEDGTRLPLKRAGLRLLLGMIVITAYYHLLNDAGFVLASALLIVALCLIYGERRGWLITPVAIAIPIALYYFFTQVAVVQIPLGLFENL